MQDYSKKVFNQCIYADWNFAINRAGWFVTKIYSHYTFEEECFKKEFISWTNVLGKMQKIPLRKIFINSWKTQILDMIVATI